MYKSKSETIEIRLSNLDKLRLENYRQFLISNSTCINEELDYKYATYENLIRVLINSNLWRLL